ncbi:MAG: thioredoxin domain-containing protein, partial [Elusimicrobia bacterium]|nr:thioredoxin domain-containing protein [Elusimicrobiota bacterium]
SDFVRRELASPDGATLWHRWRAGSRAVAGLADDYAFTAQGLIDLYEAGFEPRHLAWALTLAESAIARFGAPGGGLYQTAAGEAKELFARALEDHDGVEPAASSVLADAALRLHELTGRAGLRRYADETLERFGARAAERPLAMPYLLCALDRALGAPKTAVIAGLDLPGGAELLTAVRKTLRPDVSVAAFTDKTRDDLSALLPAVASMPRAPRAAIFICVNHACGLPLSSTAEVEKRMGDI